MKELDKYKNILLLVAVAVATFLLCRSIYDTQSRLMLGFEQKKLEVKQTKEIIDTWEGLDEQSRKIKSALLFNDSTEVKQLIEYSAMKSKVNIVSIRPSTEDKKLCDLVKMDIVILSSPYESFVNFLSDLEEKNIFVLKLSIREGTSPDDPRHVELSLGGYVVKKP